MLKRPMGGDAMRIPLCTCGIQGSGAGLKIGFRLPRGSSLNPTMSPTLGYTDTADKDYGVRVSS